MVPVIFFCQKTGVPLKHKDLTINSEEFEIHLFDRYQLSSLLLQFLILDFSANRFVQ